MAALNFDDPGTVALPPEEVYKRLEQDIRGVTNVDALKAMAAHPDVQADPTALTLIQNRLQTLQQDADTVELNPLRAIGDAVYPGGRQALQLGLDQLPSRDSNDPGVRAQQLASPLLSSVGVSKSAIGRGVDKAVSGLGGLGLALLSASQGYRGLPLNEARQVHELKYKREQDQVEEARHRAQMSMERRKQYASERKELMGHLKTVMPALQAAVKAGDKQTIAQITKDLSGLYPDPPEMVPQFIQFAANQPDNAQAMYMALAEHKLDDALSLAGSIPDGFKMLMEVVGNKQQMAAIRMWGHSKNPKKVAPLSDEEKELYGLKSAAGKQIEGAEAAIKSAEAAQAEQVAKDKAQKSQLDIQKATRELSQQDLEEYTKLFSLALKQVGGGELGDLKMLAVLSLAGKGGAVPELGKVDKAQLAEALRGFAEDQPGISDKTKLALLRAANRLMSSAPAGPEKVLKFDKQGNPVK